MDQTLSSASVEIKVAACQQPLHEKLSRDSIERILSFGPDFVSLPEHYPLPDDIQNIHQAAALFAERKEYLQSLSSDLGTVLVGGTLTELTEEGFYNTCYVFDRGREVGFYRKVNPTSREKEAGVLQGTEFKIFEVRGIRAGVLICADVLFEHSFQQMSALQCQIAFIPTASPYRPGESIEEKYERDHSIFVEGARRMKCPLVKTCGVGTTFGHRIQGRSLIVTPAGVLKRSEPHQESEPLILFASLLPGNLITHFAKH